MNDLIKEIAATKRINIQLSIRVVLIDRYCSLQLLSSPDKKINNVCCHLLNGNGFARAFKTLNVRQPIECNDIIVDYNNYTVVYAMSETS